MKFTSQCKYHKTNTFVSDKRTLNTEYKKSKRALPWCRRKERKETSWIWRSGRWPWGQSSTRWSHPMPWNLSKERQETGGSVSGAGMTARRHWTGVSRPHLLFLPLNYVRIRRATTRFFSSASCPSPVDVSLPSRRDDLLSVSAGEWWMSTGTRTNSFGASVFATDGYPGIYACGRRQRRGGGDIRRSGRKQGC